MSEIQTDDPQGYRGGAEEPADAKGGAPGGAVPRELVDEDVSGKSDPQETSEDALGRFPSESPTERVPREGGDDADATPDGGPDTRVAQPCRRRPGARARTRRRRQEK